MSDLFFNILNILASLQECEILQQTFLKQGKAQNTLKRKINNNKNLINFNPQSSKICSAYSGSHLKISLKK